MLENNILSGFADEIDRSFDRQLEVLCRLGQRWLDLRSADGIPVAQLTPEQARELRARADAAGIRVHMLASAIGKIGIADPFEPQLDLLRHLAELAEVFETSKIRIFSFYLPREEAGGTDAAAEKYRDEVLRRMQKLTDLARERSLTLFHENEKGIYGDTAERCADLMGQFYGEHFQAVFDFANFVQIGREPREAFAVLEKYVGAVHIKDARASDGEVVPAGEGDGQIREILKRLDENGFSGGLTLEPHLVDFDGFALLERETGKKKAKGDGEAAYVRAYRALEKLRRE